MDKKVLLLVGSPKPKYSTSEALGDYLIEGLNKRGFSTDKLRVRQALADDGEKLMEAINASDIILLSVPLYIDGPPAIMTKTMEIIADSRGEEGKTREQAFLVTCNCGFPEAFQNQPALDIYRCFAEQVGFKWLGGLALGGGGAINGQSLANVAGMAIQVIKSLDLTIDAISSGLEVPKEAIKLMSKPMFPNWLYSWAGDFGWLVQAKKNGVLTKINNRPYK